MVSHFRHLRARSQGPTQINQLSRLSLVLPRYLTKASNLYLDYKQTRTLFSRIDDALWLTTNPISKYGLINFD
jgi:hypothetical protein